MFSLRRAAVRVLSSSPSTTLSSKTRTFTSLRIQPTSLLTAQRTSFLPLQRRFASDEAVAQSELEADGATEAQHGDGSIAAAAEEIVDVEPPKFEEEAAAVTSESVIDEATAATTTTTDAAAAQATEQPSGGVVSEAAASIAGTAAAVGGTLSGAAGFGSDDAGPSRTRPPLEAEPTNTVYVGNLFFDVRSEDIKREFEQVGPVVNAKIIMDSRGLSKGFGYVEFSTIEHATKAISRYNLQNYEGRRISVQYSLGLRSHAPRSSSHFERPLNAPTKTLFIGNMSFDMSDRDLNNLFREIKNVIDVRVAIDRRTGQPRGFAHADFTDVASAEKAMEELRGKVVSGRALRVDFSTSSGRAAVTGPASGI